MSEETKNNNVKRHFPWRKYGLVIVGILLIGRLLWFLPRTNWSLKDPSQTTILPRHTTQEITATQKIRHILLISIDTCRADHLGCYGYSRNTSPNIDAVAAEGVLFNHAVTPVPLTLPAHSSMLTGTGPLYHKVRDNNGYRLGDSNITLAEILREKGFATAAAIGAFVLDSQFGLDQGFETYDDRISDDDSTLIYYPERSGEEITNFANNWLERNRNKNFFLFLHYFDPHANYKPHKQFAFSTSFLRFPRDLYDGEIAYTDLCIGRVIKKLKELKIYDSTMLIITADHGESLGEHKEKTHGYFTYHGTLHIPLIIKSPHWPKGVVAHQLACLIDIVPTICNSVGVPIPQQVEGKDLGLLFSDKKRALEDRYLYFESLLPTKFGLGPFLGVASNHYKYIHTVKPELYNLLKDPDENRNLLKQKVQNTKIMQAKLKSTLENSGFNNIILDSKIILNEDARKQLQSLGYVSTRTVNEDLKFEQTGKNPKEFIEVYSFYEKFLELTGDKKFDKAKKLCKDMLKKWPDMEQVQYYLGVIASREKDMNALILHFSRYLASINSDSKNSGMQVNNDYEFGNAHNNMGLAFLSQNQFEQAIAHYKKAIFYSPCNPKFFNNLTMAYLRQGKLIDALKSCKKTLALDPQLPQAHAMMGHILLNQGYLEKAITHFNEALKTSPELQDAQEGLNKALNQKKTLIKNTSALMKSLEKNPNQIPVHNKLAIIFCRMDNLKKSIYHWNTSLQLDPNQPKVLNDIAFTKASLPNESFYDPNQAIHLARQACELTYYNDPAMLDTLSVAYAATGRFNEAVQTAEKALSSAISTNRGKLVAEIKKHLKLFKAGKPYRQN